jgi:NADP-dependent 3-hydroxy acid dehydrogenase YdfG
LTEATGGGGLLDGLRVVDMALWQPGHHRQGRARHQREPGNRQADRHRAGVSGARVMVAARTMEARQRPRGAIGETAGAIEAVGGEAVAVAADVANADNLQRLVQAAMDCFGRIDVLVNNAAATSGKA